MNRNDGLPMKISYWIIRLNMPTLAKILFKNRKGEVERVTFIESGRPVLFVVKLLKRLRVISFPLHKIEPRRGVAGPVLHLSEVRNDRGAVITLDIYRHILEIRRQISCRLMDSYRAVFSFFGEKSIGLIHAWIGLKIADEISPAVYLAHYGRWKYDHGGSNDDHRNILVIPHSDFSSLLGRNLKEAGVTDRVLCNMGWQRGMIRSVRSVLNLVRSLFFSLGGTGEAKGSRITGRGKNGRKIMVHFSLGVDRDMRNDIPFLPISDFDLSRVLFYFKYANKSPSAFDLKYFKEKGIDCFADPQISETIRDIPEWRSTDIFQKERARFGRKYVKIFPRVFFLGKGHANWILAKCWEMGMKMAFWKDFFLSNNVGILVHSIASANNFIANLALSEIDGIAVDVERSIFFDYCTYIHNLPCHVRFVTGPYSAAQIQEPAFSQHTLESGAFDNFRKDGQAERLEMHKKDGRIVLALFDEIPNDVFFGNSIEDFYRAALDLASADNRFFLLIKTKKPGVLEKLPNLKKEIEQLDLEGKSLFLDWKTTVSAASSCSDMVMSLPSTAVFESVVSGTPTVVYNPMRSGSSILYRNNGYNRRIFEDAATMVAALKAFADGKDKKIGDCSDIVMEIDSFRDGLGAERIGEYLKWCLAGFDGGMSRDEILEKANESYVLKWGIAKTTDKKSHGCSE